LAIAAMLFSILAVSAPAVVASSSSPLTAKAGGGTDTCGYNDATFNESEILYGIGVFGSGFGAHVGMFVSDEKGLLLGVNGATPNTTNPQHVSDPNLGDLTATDPSGRYYPPTVYVTDVTNNAGSTAGDWQNGGTPNRHVDDVYGVWATGKFVGGTYSTDTLPAGKNGATPGAGADTPPNGQPIEAYNAVSVSNPFTGQPLTVYALKPQFASTTSILETTNVGELYESYKGLEFTVNKRMANHWQLQGSLNLSRLRGNTGGSFADPNGRVFVEGPLDLDSPVLAKVTGSYQAPWGFRLSGQYLG